MELDKRIIEGKKPLLCLDTDEAKQFIGKKGYFSNSLGWYSVLKRTWYGTLDEIESDLEQCFYNGESEGYFQYFLPAEWVKPEEPEKKYRAFTLNEFVNQYSLGDEVIMRSKNNSTVTHILFVGYKEGGDDVLLGQYWNTFMILFNNYELYIDGKWQPFGIKE